MDKIMHFHLKDACLDEDNPMRITTRLYADVVDMTDNTIVDACVKAARQAGINDVYLLDKQFVLDAIREKIERTRQEECKRKEWSERHIDLAKHAIGLDNLKPYKRYGRMFYRPYRNYFSTTDRCSDYSAWQEMVDDGCAEKRLAFCQPENAEYTAWMFSLTDKGFDRLGEIIDVKIHGMVR